MPAPITLMAKLKMSNKCQVTASPTEIFTFIPVRLKVFDRLFISCKIANYGSCKKSNLTGELSWEYSPALKTGSPTWRQISLAALASMPAYFQVSPAKSRCSWARRWQSLPRPEPHASRHGPLPSWRLSKRAKSKLLWKRWSRAY